MANEFKIKNGLILESGSLSNTSQQFVLTYNTSSGQVFYITGSSIGGGGSGAGFPYVGNAIITGSLIVSGSGITVTGSLDAPNITGSLLGTASQAYTASYAIGYPKYIRNVYDAYPGTAGFNQTSFPGFIFSANELISVGGGNFRYKLSASLETNLPAGTYQIYYVMPGATTATYYWISTTPNPTLLNSPTPPYDITSTSFISGSQSSLVSSTLYAQFTINTNIFTLTAPSDLYVIGATNAGTAPSSISISLSTGSPMARKYILYKYN